MSTERTDELLEELVQQNYDVASKLDEILRDIEEIKGELNWVGKSAFAKQVVDALGAIETGISNLEMR